MTDPPQRPVSVVPPAGADGALDRAQVARGYRLLTEEVGLLDRSELGKLALTGADAAGFLTGQVTADVEALVPGTGTYAALLTPKGKIVCDLRVLAIGDGNVAELLLLCERSGLQALFDQLRRHLIGFDAELHKRTLQQGLVSLVGPRAAQAVEGLGLPLPAEAEHDHVAGRLGELAVRVVRTDVGLDLVCDGPATASLLDALRSAGIESVPEDVAEIVRVESGRPRLGYELDPTVMPAEAGIVERAVSFTKGCYVGQETVARLHWRGRPNRHLRGLVLERAVPRGTVLVADGREIGRVTTVAGSPRRGPIALALVRREVEPGDAVTLRVPDSSPTSARVVALPFPDGERRPAPAG